MLAVLSPTLALDMPHYLVHKFSRLFILANKKIKVSKVAKGLHKIRGMKRPKMKNFNLLKKLNKTTKNKKKKKHFSKNFKGKVIDGVHELYTLTAGIMLGIRCTVSIVVIVFHTLYYATDNLLLNFNTGWQCTEQYCNCRTGLHKCG
jgi:hypothetical protein